MLDANYLVLVMFNGDGKLFDSKLVFVSVRVHASAVVELMICGIMVLIWNMFGCVENRRKICRYCWSPDVDDSQ